MAAECQSEELFVIMKRGLYFRPNAAGYTGVLAEAGTFTLDEVAARFPNIDSGVQDGMSFHALDDVPEFAPGCVMDVKLAALDAVVKSQAEEIDALREELSLFQQTADGAASPFFVSYANENGFGNATVFLTDWGIDTALHVEHLIKTRLSCEQVTILNFHAVAPARVVKKG